MNKTPLQQAKNANRRARARSDERAIRRAQELNKRANAGSGTYVSYDADSGEHTITNTLTGRQMTSTLISNSGVAPGDRVAFTRGSGGTFCKTMTR